MKRTALIITALVFLVSGKIRAQVNNDLNKISAQSFTEAEYQNRKVKFLLPASRNPVVRYNPVSLFFGSLMYTYQKVLSPQISAGCPYEISCSNFSKSLIKEYGLFKGVALTADRLSRCTQFTLIDLTPLNFNSQGRIIDPVERYRLKPKKHKHDH